MWCDFFSNTVRRQFALSKQPVALPSLLDNYGSDDATTTAQQQAIEKKPMHQLPTDVVDE